MADDATEVKVRLVADDRATAVTDGMRKSLGEAAAAANVVAQNVAQMQTQTAQAMRATGVTAAATVAHVAAVGDMAAKASAETAKFTAEQWAAVQVQAAQIMAQSAQEVAAAESHVKESVHASHEAQRSEGEHTHEEKHESLVKEIALGELAAHAIEKAWEFSYDKVSEYAHEAYENVKESIHAAIDSAESVKSLVGVLSMNNTGLSLDQLTDAAPVLQEDLENVGIKAGESAATIRRVFDEVSVRSTKSAGEVQELVEQMAKAGTAIPGGMDALGRGFAGLESGMASARNPVVQLIAATGVLHGNAKQVAHQMRTMTPEKQIRLGEEAITKMAAKIKDMPMSMGQMVTSLAGIKEQVMSAAGKPILDAILPVYAKVRDFFVEHKEHIMAAAEEVGHFIGGFIAKSAEIFGTFVQVFAFNTGALSDVIKGAADSFKDAFQWVYDHREELAKTFRDIGNVFGAVIKNELHGAQVIFDGLKKVNAYLAGAPAAPKGATVQEQMGNALTGEALDALHALNAAAADPAHKDALDAAYAKFSNVMTDKGFKEGDVRESYGAGALQINQYARQKAHADALDSTMGGDHTEADPARWAAIYNQALKGQTQEAVEYAAHVIAINKPLGEALLKSKETLEGGFSGLAEFLKVSNPELAKAFAAKALKTVTDAHPPGVGLYGGQTFHIHQDFRDQDPDRVMMVFRRDITDAAINRQVARVGTAFGP